LGTEKLILEKHDFSLGKVLIEKIWTKRFSSFPLFASHAVQDALLDLNCGLCTSRMPIGYSGRTGFRTKRCFSVAKKWPILLGKLEAMDWNGKLVICGDFWTSSTRSDEGS